MPCSGTTRSGIQRTELNRPKQGCFAALLMHFTPTDVIARPLGRGDPCGSAKGRSPWIAASAYGLLAMTRWWADAAGFPAVHRRSVPPRSATAQRGEKLRTTLVVELLRLQILHFVQDDVKGKVALYRSGQKNRQVRL